MLDVYCESYAWDEESEQNDLSVVVKDVILKKSELEALLLTFGLHLGEGGCTFGKIRFCISLGLNMDMELFTKPWRIEVDHFRLNIGCGARAECDVGRCNRRGVCCSRCDNGQRSISAFSG